MGWIFQETGSTGSVALLMLVRLAPPILGGAAAAAFVDGVRRERLLVAVELLRAVALGTVLAGLLVGIGPALALDLLTFLLAAVMFARISAAGGMDAGAAEAVADGAPAPRPRDLLADRTIVTAVAALCIAVVAGNMIEKAQNQAAGGSSKGRSKRVESTIWVCVRVTPGWSRRRSSASSRWAVSRARTCSIALASPATV
jgi:hypothetical protein